MNARYIALALVVLLVLPIFVSADDRPNHMAHRNVSKTEPTVSIVQSLYESVTKIYAGEKTSQGTPKITYPYLKSKRIKTLVPVDANKFLRAKNRVVVVDKQLTDYSVNIVKTPKRETVIFGDHNITRGSIKGVMLR